MLIIAFIQTLKQGNEKCGRDDVFKLVKDSLDEKIAREIFEELLESLIQSQSIKPNAFGDGKCLSLPKENQASAEVDKKKEILILKEEFENLKTALIEEFRNIKKSLFTDAKVLRNELLQDYDKDIPAEPSERLMNSLEKQILFLQEELRSKNKFISLLMDQLSKNSYEISSCQQ